LEDQATNGTAAFSPAAQGSLTTYYECKRHDIKRDSAGTETAYARKTRARILATAEKRFKHYGFAKTTIVDIADDCAMSHANVYRFFRNKTEIVDAIAVGWLAKIERVCADVASGRCRPPTPHRFVVELHAGSGASTCAVRARTNC